MIAARSSAFFGAIALGSTLTLVLALAHAGCGDDRRDLFIASFDSGPDVVVEEASTGDAGGLDPTLGGPCTDDTQCDDQIACTFDRCDAALSRCRNTPDDTQCQDGIHCNGVERCVLRRGCAPGAVVTCQDENGCTIDRCVEATKACEHKGRDSDGDGDLDDHCTGGTDCDDTDPAVSSKRAEVCGNFKDDNCNGQVDEQPCTVPAHDTCAAALAVTGAGSYALTTASTKPDYGTSCATTTSGQDVVVAITVPSGGPRDVVVRARTSPNESAEVGVALETTCGDTNSEIQCQRVTDVPDARTIARSVNGGATIYAIITTVREAAVDLSVMFAAPTTKPANETCNTAKLVALETPVAVSLIDPKRDFASDCKTGATGGELTYAFVLPEKRDVRIFATTTLGTGSPIVSLRDSSACATEQLRCRTGSAPVFARSLAAGTYVFSVSGTSQIDANVLVKTYPATDPPAGQSCTTAPPIEPNKTIAIDLTNHEDAIANGCEAGLPNTSYALSLPVASDVLLVGRFPLIESGAVSLSAPACTSNLVCSFGGTPQRASLRNHPAGEYRVVVGDQLAQSATVIALVRPTTPPTTVTGADGCTDAFSIPIAGGFFTGDTTSSTADFNAGCDSVNQPAGTAKDQLMRLVLPEKKRVVFDMSGSEMITLLDVRTGEPCPGIELTGGCNPGFGPSGSFLDLTLDAGTYWVQIDGYNGATGTWNLDVRVLPPD